MNDPHKNTVDGLDVLLVELAGRGYDLIGPTVREGVVVFDRISSVADLARGVVDDQSPGEYHLRDSEALGSSR